MIPQAVSVKAYLIFFFFVPSWIRSCLCVTRVKKSVFLVQILWIRNGDLRIVFFNEFNLFLKKTSCVRLPKENLFIPNNASETYISISWGH